jgi:CheY-like chemotaxis protein
MARKKKRHSSPGTQGNRFMALEDDDLSDLLALVIDSNPGSRAILVNQLREFGVGTVEQTMRTAEARRMLENRKFDIVLCEQHFQPGTPSGQDFLDELRRQQILPFSTIFIMVTSEASYTKVAEAAESALDGYLIKPHTAARLADRLDQARQRKAALNDIFSAVSTENYEKAADLCMARFQAKEPYWLYAARIGAELLIRLQRYDEAHRMYEAVIEAKTLPWAKLGVARVQIGKNETQRAVGTLEALISEEPQFADAYDVLGRAQFELGNHDQALAAYKLACSVTPYSITRLQSLGHLYYYKGEYEEAQKILGQSARQGLGSKMFDPQTLMLLAFIAMQSDDRRALQRCREDLAKLTLREDEYGARVRSMEGILGALRDILDKEFGRAANYTRDLAKRVRDPDFDIELAADLIVLMSHLASRTLSLGLDLDDFLPVLDTLAERFVSGRSMNDLLSGAARAHLPFAERLRIAGEHPIKLMESAVKLGMNGDPNNAIRQLMKNGQDTLNARLMSTALLVLQKYDQQIPDATAQLEAINEWRAQYGGPGQRPALGAAENARPPGGITINAAPEKKNAPAATPPGGKASAA